MTDDPILPPGPASIARAADTDAALVARAQGGDRAAVAALVDRHQAVAFRVCYRVLGEREDAADAAQEAFLRAYRRLDSFRGQSTFKTWFMRLTVNVALNERARQEDHLPLDSETLLTRRDADDSHDTGLVRAEAAAQIHQALQLLPPNHRTTAPPWSSAISKNSPMPRRPPRSACRRGRRRAGRTGDGRA